MRKKKKFRHKAECKGYCNYSECQSSDQRELIWPIPGNSFPHILKAKTPVLPAGILLLTYLHQTFLFLYDHIPSLAYMKHTLQYLIILTLFFCSCEFHQSQKVDLITGAVYRGDGLSSDDVTISINERVQNRNEIVFGEKLVLGFNNMQGLKRVNGLAFPGMAMFIVKNERDTVLAHKDLLESLQDGTDLEPLLLEASFTANFPAQGNEKYKAFIHIWDKKGEGRIDYEFPFTVSPNKALSVSASGITYSSIYLWDETKKQVIVNNEVDIRNETMLLINDVKGLAEKNNLVFPKLSLDLVDKAGNVVLSNPNILSGVEQTGIIEISQIPVVITFTGEQINNPVKLNAVLTDMNSDRKLVITGSLVIK